MFVNVRRARLRQPAYQITDYWKLVPCRSGTENNFPNSGQLFQNSALSLLVACLSLVALLPQCLFAFSLYNEYTASSPQRRQQVPQPRTHSNNVRRRHGQRAHGIPA